MNNSPVFYLEAVNKELNALFSRRFLGEWSSAASLRAVFSFRRQGWNENEFYFGTSKGPKRTQTQSKHLAVPSCQGEAFSARVKWRSAPSSLPGLLEDERLASAHQAEAFTRQIQNLQGILVMKRRAMKPGGRRLPVSWGRRVPRGKTVVFLLQTLQVLAASVLKEINWNNISYNVYLIPTTLIAVSLRWEERTLLSWKHWKNNNKTNRPWKCLLPSVTSGLLPTHT